MHKTNETAKVLRCFICGKETVGWKIIHQQRRGDVGWLYWETVPISIWSGSYKGKLHESYFLEEDKDSVFSDGYIFATQQDGSYVEVSIGA